jgi:glycosyltransferase involved in cell wall biosynthesis
MDAKYVSGDLVSDAPRITLIVPFAFGLGYLQRLLLSIQHQTEKNWRLVLMDDSGNLDRASLGPLASDPRAILVPNAMPLGIPGNWNEGLNRVTTEYAAIIHADDELLPDFVVKMIQLMDAEPMASIGFCRVELIDDKNRRTFSFADWIKVLIRRRPDHDRITRIHGREGVHALLRGDWIYCPTAVFNMKILCEERFAERWKFVADYAFFLRLLISGHLLVGREERLYRYRRHSLSTTSVLTKNLRRFVEEHALLDEIAFELSEQKFDRGALLAKIRPIYRVQTAAYLLKSIMRWDGTTAVKLGRLLIQR